MNENTNSSSDNQTIDQKNFDPMKDIDLSAIESEIIDTSKGNPQEGFHNQVYSFKCLSCGFVYEGYRVIDKCPKCGSDKIYDVG